MMMNRQWHSPGRSILAGTLALAGLAFPAVADETDARAILAAMSDYLSGQQTFSFEYDATLDIVTTEDQKIGLASSGKVAVQRPGQIHATRKGGFANLEMAYDGATFTLIGRDVGMYTQVALGGDIEGLIDTLRDEHGVVFPAADLLMADPQAILMEGVTDVKDLGSGVIDGQECDHIALRRPELDLQIWVAQGDTPYPCRYVVTTREVPHQPQYSVQIDDWTTDVDADDLSFDLPDGAREVDLTDLSALVQELPDNFSKGNAQ